MVYLDVVVDELRVTDAQALLLPDQKRRSHRKQQRFNVPAQQASFERIQQATAQSPTPDGQVLLATRCTGGSVCLTLAHEH